MPIQLDNSLIIDLWSCIVNTVVPKAGELSAGIIELSKWLFWELEVSVILCLQQSNAAYYVELFMLICPYAGWEWEFMAVLCKLYTFSYFLESTYKILPLKAWILIWCRRGRSYVKCVEWRQCQDIGLLNMMLTH